MHKPLALALSLFAFPLVAHAGKGDAQAAPAQQQVKVKMPTQRQLQGLVKQVARARAARLQFTSRFFAKITQARDYTGEHVLRVNDKVTAFLDMSDPRHPKYDPTMVDESAKARKIPVGQRAHILVVPNTPRAHIAKSVSGKIKLEDIQATHEVLLQAHQLAEDLKLKDYEVYINTSDRIGVGYLHAHIVGAHDGSAYPMVPNSVAQAAAPMQAAP